MRRLWVCRDRFHFNGASMPVFLRFILGEIITRETLCLRLRRLCLFLPTSTARCWIFTHSTGGLRPWLEKLMDEQVPVILCSSKTASEMDDIQQELGLGGLPYIAENGAVIQPDVRWKTPHGSSQKRSMTISGSVLPGYVRKCILNSPPSMT